MYGSRLRSVVSLRTFPSQLFTTAHHEGADDAVGIWCWFDIIMLANAGATEPLVKDGCALVWWSYDIPFTATQTQAGELFGASMRFLGFLMLVGILLFCLCLSVHSLFC